MMNGRTRMRGGRIRRGGRRGGRGRDSQHGDSVELESVY